MKQNIVTRDRILILISGFFYFASPMLVTPLITGFSENLGASAALMGVIGGLMNICSLFAALLLEILLIKSVNISCLLLVQY